MLLFIWYVNNVNKRVSENLLIVIELGNLTINVIIRSLHTKPV